MIAAEAGLCHATVSLALRNHPSIPGSTRARIQRLAAKLGYRQNALVSALMKQVRTKTRITAQETIAYLTADGTSDRWMKDYGYRQLFLAGAKARADSLGFAIKVFWTGPFGRNAGAVSKILDARAIRGVIFAPFPTHHEQLVFNWDTAAMAAIGFSFGQIPIHRACHHQVNGMICLYNELYKIGYRRIGLAILLEDLIRARHYYLSGYLTCESMLGTPAIPVLVFNDESEEKKLIPWMRKNKPEVIISIGYYVYDWLINAKIRIPEDVAFAHLNLDDACQSLAGIDQKLSLVGETAVDLVLGQLYRNEYGIPQDPKMVLLDGVWRPGPSAPGR